MSLCDACGKDGANGLFLKTEYKNERVKVFVCQSCCCRIDQMGTARRQTLAQIIVALNLSEILGSIKESKQSDAG